MSDPYLFVPIFSWPAAPGGQLYSYYAGGTVNAPTYAASGAVNTNPVILDANGSASVRRDPDISYHFVLKDSTGQSTIWDADNFPVDAFFSSATTIAAASTVDLGTATSHSALIHGAGATISSFGASANTGSPLYFVQFDGTNTLVNSSTLVLPGNASISTAAGDAAIAQFVGTGWNVLFYQQGFVSGGPAGAISSDICLIKKTGQSVTSNAAYFQDTNLTTPLLQIGYYEFELFLLFASNNAVNGGFKFQLEVPAANIQAPACSITYNVNGTGGSLATTFTASSVAVAAASFATCSNIVSSNHQSDWVLVRGSFQVAGAASPAQLFWSQNTSSAAFTNLGAGSMLKVRTGQGA